MGVGPSGGSLFIQFNGPGETWPANSLAIDLSKPIRAGEWTHVAASYDGERLNLYQNGTLLGSRRVGHKSVASSAANLRISGDDNGNCLFNGLIDDPAVFDRALDAGEIEVIYRATVDGHPIDGPERAPPMQVFGEKIDDFVRIRAAGGLHTWAEYSGPIDVSFMARTDKLNIRLSYGRAGVIWNWEVDPKQLHISRLDGTALAVPVTPLKPDRWYAFRFIVTPQGLRIMVDNAVVFEESRSSTIFPPAHVRVHTAETLDSIIDVKDFTVKPIDWLTPAQQSLLARHANAGTVDVLPLIDTARDATSGKWTNDFRGLHAPADCKHAALRLPVAVPEEYCLTVVAERPIGRKGVGPSLDIGLVCARAQATCNIDWERKAGISMIDGKWAIANESAVECGNLLEEGRTSV